MAGTSDGLRAAWQKRRALYGPSGVRPEVAQARAAGRLDKKTVAILDRPFRLAFLTPDTLALWRSEYRETLTRADRIITYWTKHRRQMTEHDQAQVKTLLRYARQYRRALETGSAYLENTTHTSAPAKPAHKPHGTRSGAAQKTSAKASRKRQAKR